MNIYARVRATGRNNFLEARVEVPHALDNEAWERYRGVISNPITIEFIKYGFPTGYVYESLPQPTTKNHSSAIAFPSFVDKYIETERKHGAMLGPYAGNPFDWVMTSPIMTRYKDGGKDKRVILDLSYPPHMSVNASIPVDRYLGEEYRLH